MTDRMLTDLLEGAGSRIPVGPAPVPVILAEATRRRRLRTAGWVAAATVTTAVSVIVSVALAGRADDAQLDPVQPVTRTAATPLEEWAHLLPEGAPPAVPFALGTTLYDRSHRVSFPSGSTGGGVVGRVQGGWLILVEQVRTSPYRFRSWFGVLTPSGDFTRLPESRSGLYVQEAAVDPDGALVATEVVVDVATNDVVTEVPNLPGSLMALGWSPLGITYDSSGSEGTRGTWVWDPGDDPVRTDVELSQVVPGSTHALAGGRFGDDCSDVVDVRSSGGTRRLWRGCGDDSPVVLSPDGQHAITRDGGIIDVRTGSVDRIEGVGPALPGGIGWEEDEHILFHVRGSGDGEVVIVRCSITTLTCERAGNELRVGPRESLEFTGPGEH